MENERPNHAGDDWLINVLSSPNAVDVIYASTVVDGATELLFDFAVERATVSIGAKIAESDGFRGWQFIRPWTFGLSVRLYVWLEEPGIGVTGHMQVEGVPPTGYSRKVGRNIVRSTVNGFMLAIEHELRSLLNLLDEIEREGQSLQAET